MQFYEGRAWLSRCPKELCALPTILAHVDGTKVQLSTKSIPLNDALVFQKYERTVFNLWVGPTRMWVVTWFRDQGRPLRGRLYIKHICGARP